MSDDTFRIDSRTQLPPSIFEQPPAARPDARGGATLSQADGRARDSVGHAPRRSLEELKRAIAGKPPQVLARTLPAMAAAEMPVRADQVTLGRMAKGAVMLGIKEGVIHGGSHYGLPRVGVAHASAAVVGRALGTASLAVTWLQLVATMTHEAQVEGGNRRLRAAYADGMARTLTGLLYPGVDQDANVREGLGHAKELQRAWKGAGRPVASYCAGAETAHGLVSTLGPTERAALKRALIDLVPGWKDTLLRNDRPADFQRALGEYLNPDLAGRLRR